MARTALNRAGFVYFVQEAELRRVKIGFTMSHPASRLKALANASSQELFFIGFEVGSEQREAVLHRKFAHLHCRNEWFEPGTDLLQYVEALRYGSEFEKALQAFILAPGQRKPAQRPRQISGMESSNASASSTERASTVGQAARQ